MKKLLLISLLLLCGCASTHECKQPLYYEVESTYETLPRQGKRISKIIPVYKEMEISEDMIREIKRIEYAPTPDSIGVFEEKEEPNWTEVYMPIYYGIQGVE